MCQPKEWSLLEAAAVLENSPQVKEWSLLEMAGVQRKSPQEGQLAPGHCQMAVAAARFQQEGWRRAEHWPQDSWKQKVW